MIFISVSSDFGRHITRQRHAGTSVGRDIRAKRKDPAEGSAGSSSGQVFSAYSLV
jgi:hypothetical protein